MITYSATISSLTKDKKDIPILGLEKFEDSKFTIRILKHDLEERELLNVLKQAVKLVEAGRW